MARPLVSILTGTYPPRVEDAVETMRHIREQDYPSLEHCIAVEGEPDEVDAVVTRLRLEAAAMSVHIPTRIVGLGRWWSRFLTNSVSVVPFQVAQWMARGDLLMWWSDDERALVHDHVSALVDHLESGPYDFVSPLVEAFHADTPDQKWVVGVDPPEAGTITHALYRASLLDITGFRPHVGSGSDWDQVEMWLDGGARFGLLNRVTFSHRGDKRPWLEDIRA